MTTSAFASLRAHPINAAPQASVTAWWPSYLQVCGDWASPIERALAGGAAADRVLFEVAATARAARFARACANLGLGDVHLPWTGAR